jgi:hypothetical protein
MPRMASQSRKNCTTASIADPGIVLKPFLNRASLDDSRPHHGKDCRLNCFGVEPVDPWILPEDNLDPSPIEIETLCFMCVPAMWNKIRLLMRAYLSSNNNLSGKHMHCPRWLPGLHETCSCRQSKNASESQFLLLVGEMFQAFIDRSCMVNTLSMDATPAVDG